MSNKEPAFPTLDHHQDAGMSLRDYFAAKAMQSEVVKDKFYVGMDKPHWTKQAARTAYMMADAMLEARK
jgi:hypothetical protein